MLGRHQRGVAEALKLSRGSSTKKARRKRTTRPARARTGHASRTYGKLQEVIAALSYILSSRWPASVASPLLGSSWPSHAGHTSEKEIV